MIPRSTVVATAFLLSLAGCGEESIRAAGETVSDSAGVRIVALPAPEVEEVSLAGREVVRFADYDFIRVRQGAIRADGAVAVSDPQGDAVVVLDPEGRLSHEITGPGEGPAEVSGPFAVLWLGGDTLLVQDTGNGRHSFFLGGQVLDTRRLPFVVGFGVLRTRLPGGSIIVEDGAYSPISSEVWVTEEVYRYDYGAQTTDTILEYDIARGRGAMASMPPFSPWGAFAASETRMITVRGDRAEVRVHDTKGTLSEIWRWSEQPPPTTGEIWDAWVERVMTGGGRSSEQERRARLAEQRELMPSTLPFTSSIHLDDRGRAWIGEYSIRGDAGLYRVFSSEGRRLVNVRVPPRTTVLDIRHGRLLAVVLDDFDVPTVTLFDLSEVFG